MLEMLFVVKHALLEFQYYALKFFGNSVRLKHETSAFWGIFEGNVHAWRRFRAVSLQWTLGVSIRFFLVQQRSCLSEFMYDCMNNLPVWSCNVLKLKPESSLCFPYRTTFHIRVAREHSLFHCVAHTYHLDTWNNTTEWMFNLASQEE
jgi:hypothetical protein